MKLLTKSNQKVITKTNFESIKILMKSVIFFGEILNLNTAKITNKNTLVDKQIEKTYLGLYENIKVEPAECINPTENTASK